MKKLKSISVALATSLSFASVALAGDIQTPGQPYLPPTVLTIKTTDLSIEIVLLQVLSALSLL